MKFAGKAFIAGFAGWLGAGTAIGFTIVLTGFVAQRQIKRGVTHLEEQLRTRTDQLINDLNDLGEEEKG